MSRIDEMIQELCPGGVAFSRLADVARIRNGKDYKSLGAGEIPVFGTGGVMTTVDTAAYPGPSVLIPRKGSLSKLYYVDAPFWTVDTIFYTEIDDSRMVPKFLYYFLATQHLEDLNQAGGVPSLTQAVLNALEIPIPPLELQLEIVRVLDLFTALEAELEAELEARRHQYTHYRDSLLTFPEGTVRWIPMGELADLNWGNTAITKKSYVTQGTCWPAFSASGQDGFLSFYDFDRSAVVLSAIGAQAGKTWRTSGKWSCIKNTIRYFSRDESVVTTDYLYWITSRVRTFPRRGSAQPFISKGDADAVLIPVPPLDEQARIVAILDRFDALVNDLSVGLPAELAARRKQYEYYRDRLLSFKEAVA